MTPDEVIQWLQANAAMVGPTTDEALNVVSWMCHTHETGWVYGPSLTEAVINADRINCRKLHAHTR